MKIREVVGQLHNLVRPSMNKRQRGMMKGMERSWGIYFYRHVMGYQPRRQRK
ncbi:MAG TPA: hypothetical protein PLT82_11950 [Candidatus Hydrogenedens sp.]|nr:hypothetical protein [Candidatus Hydrogenedens sp.]HOK10339.1 hypothetical protein [Candidatus Hydrogenedens sp.]HOL20325.1 hypothetical protein [Candidatus Hydrogenedens sp.]HPP59834.1 hypothetical protein [Candidatus Hydrogenedens sp.]